MGRSGNPWRFTLQARLGMHLGCGGSGGVALRSARDGRRRRLPDGGGGRFVHLHPPSSWASGSPVLGAPHPVTPPAGVAPRARLHPPASYPPTHPPAGVSPWAHHRRRFSPWVPLAYRRAVRGMLCYGVLLGSPQPALLAVRSAGVSPCAHHRRRTAVRPPSASFAPITSSSGLVTHPATSSPGHVINRPRHPPGHVTYPTRCHTSLPPTHTSPHLIIGSAVCVPYVIAPSPSPSWRSSPLAQLVTR